MNDDQCIKEKVNRLIQSLVHKEWLTSEMELSARHDRLEKARRSRMKNKIPLPNHPSAAHESD